MIIKSIFIDIYYFPLKDIIIIILFDIIICNRVWEVKYIYFNVHILKMINILFIEYYLS